MTGQLLQFQQLQVRKSCISLLKILASITGKCDRRLRSLYLMQSTVDIAFWAELGRLKLSTLRLSEEAQPITGQYSGLNQRLQGLFPDYYVQLAEVTFMCICRVLQCQQPL